MKAELESVYPFVKKWMVEQGMELEIPQQDGTVYWVDDYIEYKLYLNYFGMPQLKADNIEMTWMLLLEIAFHLLEQIFLSIMNILMSTI